MALTFYRPLIFLLATCLVIYLVWLQHRLRLRWWPAWILRSLLVLAALVGFFFPQGEILSETLPPREILILDRSDSIALQEKGEMVEWARQWHNQRSNRVVIIAGETVDVVVNPDQEWPAVDGRASNLASAVELAAEMFGDAGQSNGGRIILASDGLASNPLLVSAAAGELKAAGLRLDVLPMNSRSDPKDISLGPLSLPAVLWEKTPLNVVVQANTIDGKELETITWQVLVNEEEQAVKPDSLGGGSFLFRLPAQNEGIVAITVKALKEGDFIEENNVSHGIVTIYRPPQVLFVTAQPAERFTGLLVRNGLEQDTISPGDFSPDLAGLAQYQVIFINNVLQNSFTAQQMVTIRNFAAERGGGVIFLGGQNGYTLGGYKNSILEPMFPVKLEPPNREQRSPVIFLLVLDNSSSMTPVLTEPGQVMPLVLAKEAGIRAIEMLDTRDWLGVLTFSDEIFWRQPIRALGDGIALREAMDAVGRIDSQSTTNMYAGLQEAVKGLEAIPTSEINQRNLLLLTDGKSGDGSPEQFNSLAQEAFSKGITISTIALGEEVDLELLKNIAELGGGRFYAVRDAQDLPRIMMNESRAARSENIQEGLTSLKPGEPGHPVLSGLSGERLPVVNGYNALQSRMVDSAAGTALAGSTAEDILLSSSFSDPILSAWQYGLGRVVAWMSDLGQTWSQPWQDENDEGYFWAQVVRYALPNPALGETQVEVTTDASHTRIRAFIQDKAYHLLNMLDVKFTYTSAGDKVRTLSLPQVEPGVYQLELPRLPEGSYRAMVEYSLNGQDKQQVLVPFAVNAPEEWNPVSQAMAEQGRASLKSWAEITGGSMLSDLVSGVEVNGKEEKREVSRSVQWIILLVLVISWPLEIAARRRWLPWASVGKE